MFDPQEVRGAVADHGRHLSVLLPLQQHGHKMVDFIHVHVAHVVTADQHLDAQRRELDTQAMSLAGLFRHYISSSG